MSKVRLITPKGVEIAELKALEDSINEQCEANNESIESIAVFQYLNVIEAESKDDEPTQTLQLFATVMVKSL